MWLDQFDISNFTVIWIYLQQALAYCTAKQWFVAVLCHSYTVCCNYYYMTFHFCGCVTVGHDPHQTVLPQWAHSKWPRQWYPWFAIISIYRSNESAINNEITTKNNNKNNKRIVHTFWDITWICVGSCYVRGMTHAKQVPSIGIISHGLHIGVVLALAGGFEYGMMFAVLHACCIWIS